MENLEYFLSLEKENNEQRRHIQWLKSCKNCKKFKECTRHDYGMTIHGCDHWEDVCGEPPKGYIEGNT